MRKFYFAPFLFAAILAVTFLIYHHRIIALPLADQHWFLQNRPLATSEFNFFIKALSFNRTGQINPGDHSLFRPGMTGTLALVDIFLWDHPYIAGALTLIWHALAALGLYLVLSTQVSLPLSLLFTAFFTVQYSGCDMVLWRHISPYLFSLIFLATATAQLPSVDLSRRRPRWVLMALFFLACLFHEVVPLSLLVAGAALGVRGRKSDPRLYEIGTVLLKPSLLFYLINLGDFLVYKSGRLLIHLANDGVHNTALLAKLELLGNLTGLLGLAAYFPQIVTLTFEPDKSTRPYNWDFSALLQSPALPILGCALFALILLATLKELRDLGRRSNRKNVVPFLILVHFMVLALGLTVGRVAERGITYFIHSPYYYYFGNFFLILILAIYVDRFLQRQTFPLFYRRISLAALSVFFLFQTATDAKKIRALLRPAALPDRTTIHAMDEILVHTRKPEFCYGGALGRTTIELIPETLLTRVSCELKKGNPLFAYLGAGGFLQLGTVRDFAEIPPSNRKTLLKLSEGELREKLRPVVKLNLKLSENGKEEVFYSPTM